MSLAARFTTFALVAASVSVVPAARATGVLAPATAPDPTLDVRIAVTKTAASTSTRWSRITASGVGGFLWLVPARPGAAVDYASDAWLTSLDDATAPRVLPVVPPPSCRLRGDVERVPTWGVDSTTHYPVSVTVLATAAEARARASGYRMTAAMDQRIADAYESGWAFVALELDAPGGARVSSPTVRVTDDGGSPAGVEGLVPLALTGGLSTASRITAFVIGEGAASLPGVQDLDPERIVWNTRGSNYADERAALLGTGAGRTWLRESATGDTVFGDQPIPGAEPIAALYRGYFGLARGQSVPSCESAAFGAWRAQGAVGRACAPGSLANVPGGATCAPVSAAIDPAALTCGAGVDDLALALAGIAPRNAVVTRFSGIVPAGRFGADLPIRGSRELSSPLIMPGRHDGCPKADPPPPPRPPLAGPSGGSAGSGGYYRTTESCDGTTVVFVADDWSQREVVSDDEGCGGSTIDAQGGGASSSSSSSESSESSTESSGWDTPDTDSDSCDSSRGSRSDDSCGSSTSSSDDSCGSSSSSSDDSCGSSSSSGDSCDSSSGSDDACSSSSGSGGDSCDTKSSGADSCDCAKGAGASNGASGNGSVVKTARARSPFSRLALLFAVIAFPLRRLGRRHPDG
ncbi:MAG: hypothetical protein KF819_28840 [Labilithrix sp.]|nr:hypothetical protein [Labilithrix sp.]